MSKSIIQKKRILTKAGGGSSLATPVSVANGGTGISSYAIGDIIYASGTTTLSKLAGVSVGQFLLSGGVATAPAYSGTALTYVGTVLTTPNLAALSTINLGASSSATGILYFKNSGNANTVGVQTGATSASYTLTLPTAQGGASTFLQNNGSGVLSWATAASGITIGGTAIGSGADNRILFQDATASDFVTQTANFTMGSVASGYLDVPTGYALGGSKLIKYNENGVGGLSFGIGADPTGGGFYYHNLAIGINAVASAGNSGIAIGYGSTTTAASQLVIGSSGDPISSVYIGSGVTAVSPSSITYNATGGSGTNIAGASLTLAGGKGTGTGAGGSVILSTALQATTSSTIQPTLTPRLTISYGAVTTDASTATWADALNFVFGSTTGTKIATATTQKIGFWNATPIVQLTTAVGSATLASPGAGTSIKSDDTFDGYTLQQIVKALRNLGILA